MDLTPYVDQLRDQLLISVEAADGDIATALDLAVRQLDPAARLAFMSALSEASECITRLLQQCGTGACVQLTLSGREPDFLVQVHHVQPVALPVTPDLDDLETGNDDTTEDAPDTTARITLRLPESVKRRADELADAADISLNTFIVEAVRAAIAGGRYGQGRQHRIHRRDCDGDIDLSAPVVLVPPTPLTRSRGKRLTGWL